jgi:WD40 repeat protein
MAFSPDGRLLTVAFFPDDRPRVLSVADPAHPFVLATLAVYGGGIPDASFGPQGTVLSLSEGAMSDNSALRSGLWDLSDPSHPAPATTLMASLGPVTATALSPRTPVLAAAGPDGAVSLWDIGRLRTPQPLGTVPGATTRLPYLRFSPDGSALAGIDDSGGIHLWDVSAPNRITLAGDFPAQTDKEENTVQLTAALAGRGRLIVSSGTAGTTAISDTSPESLTKRLCSAVGDPLSTSQWHRYVPEAGFSAPCDPQR